MLNLAEIRVLLGFSIYIIEGIKGRALGWMGETIMGGAIWEELSNYHELTDI
jgi:hypothetical protein